MSYVTAEMRRAAAISSAWLKALSVGRIKIAKYTDADKVIFQRTRYSCHAWNRRILTYLVPRQKKRKATRGRRAALAPTAFDVKEMPRTQRDVEFALGHSRNFRQNSR